MKKIIISLFLLVMGISLNAQNCTYDFNVSTDTYQNLTNSISLNNGTVWDDPNYTIPVGFDFTICGNTYQTIYFSGFGSGGMLATSQNPTDNLAIISPIAQDIVDLGDMWGTSQSPLSYQTVGSPGNRILKIEWKNVGFWGNPTDYLNFQVWFYENNNSIAYHYGPSSVTNTMAFEGETGPIVFFFPLINLNTGVLFETGYGLVGNPSNPTLVVLDPNNPPSSGSSNALNGMIPPGTIYTFTPDNLSVESNENMVFSVFPNPAKNVLTFKTNTAFGKYSVQFFTLTGQNVKTFSDIKNNKINISDLASGIYFVKVTNAKGVSGIRKIIKK